MGKRVFVSADWKEGSDFRSCDKIVVDKIRQWANDRRLSVELDCTDDVHDSVVYDPDCRRCDIKGECGRHIDRSSIVIFVVGDNTADKSSGWCNSESCSPAYSGQVKENCKYKNKNSPSDDVTDGRKMSYLQYEITKAAIAGKTIILVFNSMQNEGSWIPTWYDTLRRNYKFTEQCRVPFWKNRERTQDCYQDIKDYLL